MIAKLAGLLLLVACHASSPSVSSGPGSAEPAAPAPPNAEVRVQQDAAATRETPEPAGTPATAPPATAPTPPASTPPAPSPEGAGKAPGIGETCGANDACAPGLTCIRYYGFAGARGPQFKSCEVRCENNKACPKGLVCMAVADGPGQVCR